MNDDLWHAYEILPFNHDKDAIASERVVVK